MITHDELDRSEHYKPLGLLLADQSILGGLNHVHVTYNGDHHLKKRGDVMLNTLDTSCWTQLLKK